ncbi:hypothetical protein Q8F55_008643 [Vanrija albida]|uniref:Uncharacterized protein n=1 Tax=Vanrija albida TaxID=181172 RepID=A0ABR3PRK9_9TREE
MLGAAAGSVSFSALHALNKEYAQASKVVLASIVGKMMGNDELDMYYLGHKLTFEEHCEKAAEHAVRLYTKDLVEVMSSTDFQQICWMAKMTYASQTGDTGALGIEQVATDPVACQMTSAQENYALETAHRLRKVPAAVRNLVMFKLHEAQNDPAAADALAATVKANVGWKSAHAVCNSPAATAEVADNSHDVSAGASLVPSDPVNDSVATAQVVATLGVPAPADVSTTHTDPVTVAELGVMAELQVAQNDASVDIPKTNSAEPMKPFWFEKEAEDAGRSSGFGPQRSGRTKKKSKAVPFKPGKNASPPDQLSPPTTPTGSPSADDPAKTDTVSATVPKTNVVAANQTTDTASPGASTKSAEVAAVAGPIKATSSNQSPSTATQAALSHTVKTATNKTPSASASAAATPKEQQPIQVPATAAGPSQPAHAPAPKPEVAAKATESLEDGEWEDVDDSVAEASTPTPPTEKKPALLLRMGPQVSNEEAARVNRASSQGETKEQSSLAPPTVAAPAPMNLAPPAVVQATKTIPAFFGNNSAHAPAPLASTPPQSAPAPMASTNTAATPPAEAKLPLALRLGAIVSNERLPA